LLALGPVAARGPASARHPAKLSSRVGTIRGWTRLARAVGLPWCLRGFDLGHWSQRAGDRSDLLLKCRARYLDGNSVMAFQDDLDLVVAHTRHERYRELCDPSGPHYNEGYLDVVSRQAEALRTSQPVTPPPPVLPTFLNRVGNFVEAVVEHIAAGMPSAQPDEIAARLAICQPCDQRLPGNQCAGCGCNLAWKASWADQDCPLGKWPKLESSVIA
jgi:hypothetical protein